MLSRTEISQRNLVTNPSQDCMRASSYDLRIDCIIDSGGKVHYDNHVLAPQEVAWVVSKETLVLPDGVTAIAHIKTGLCNDGLLALNTGIVDPGWQGPLATAILNFGRLPHMLRVNEQFLRVTFYAHGLEGEPLAAIQRHKYVADKQDKAIKFFGDKFLDANAILKEAVNNNIFKYAGIFGVAAAIFVAAVGAVLTLGAILVNSNAFYAPTYYSSQLDRAAETVAKLERRIEELSEEVKTLGGAPR